MPRLTLTPPPSARQLPPDDDRDTFGPLSRGEKWAVAGVVVFYLLVVAAVVALVWWQL